MEQTESINAKDLAGGLPNELVMMAYYPVAREFGIDRYGYDADGDNQEFFDKLSIILNPNLDVVVAFKRKTEADDYNKKSKRLKERFSGEQLEEKMEKLSESHNKREEDLDFLVSLKNKFFASLSKLDAAKISSFMDGAPIIEQTFNNNGYFYRNSTIMIASKDSVVWVYAEKDEPPKANVVYAAKDKAKMDKALHRDTKTFDIQPPKAK